MVTFRLKAQGPLRLVNSKLEIKEISNKDFASYKCVAQNVKGTSSSSNALIAMKSRSKYKNIFEIVSFKNVWKKLSFLVYKLFCTILLLKLC